MVTVTEQGRLFPREGGDPDWAPAFAGEQWGSVLPQPHAPLCSHCTCPEPPHHPGGGRGPIGKVVVTRDCAPLATSPNWAPAFAGVVLVVRVLQTKITRVR